MHFAYTLPHAFNDKVTTTDSIASDATPCVMFTNLLQEQTDDSLVSGTVCFTIQLLYSFVIYDKNASLSAKA
jgi:hypothetical protein